MQIIAEEKLILRELAIKYRRYAEDPINEEREQRARRINALLPDRPIVSISEVPWNEFNSDGQLTLRCSEPFARRMERFFRLKIFQWEHFQADMVLDKSFLIRKAYHSTGDGMTVLENVRSVDVTNSIISHSYIDQLDNEEKLSQLQLPIITALPETDKERLLIAKEVLEGIMPVLLIGTYFPCSPWDRLAQLRGVEPIYYDLALRPDLIHATMRRCMEIYTSKVDQMEALCLFSSNISDLHCTPGWSDELEQTERKNGCGNAKSTWFRGMAQMFGSISPEMHEEFDINYIIPLASRFGLTYYGCCEPLDDRIEELKKIPNLRKVGSSPWANVNAIAEQLGKNYVLSKKPNPALVSGTLNEAAIRTEVRETAEACLKYGCPWDYTLKDISTVGYRPNNLTQWNEIVQRTLDEYY